MLNNLNDIKMEVNITDELKKETSTCTVRQDAPNLKGEISLITKTHSIKVNLTRGTMMETDLKTDVESNSEMPDSSVKAPSSTLSNAFNNAESAEFESGSIDNNSTQGIDRHNLVRPSEHAEDPMHLPPFFDQPPRGRYEPAFVTHLQPSILNQPIFFQPLRRRGEEVPVGTLIPPNSAMLDSGMPSAMPNSFNAPAVDALDTKVYRARFVPIAAAECPMVPCLQSPRDLDINVEAEKPDRVNNVEAAKPDLANKVEAANSKVDVNVESTENNFDLNVQSPKHNFGMNVESKENTLDLRVQCPMDDFDVNVKSPLHDIGVDAKSTEQDGLDLTVKSPMDDLTMNITSTDEDHNLYVQSANSDIDINVQSPISDIAIVVKGSGSIHTKPTEGLDIDKWDFKITMTHRDMVKADVESTKLESGSIGIESTEDSEASNKVNVVIVNTDSKSTESSDGSDASECESIQSWSLASSESTESLDGSTERLNLVEGSDSSSAAMEA